MCNNNETMETQYIIEFVTLAQTKSFSESSRLLHISQSSLSRHIQMLEKELGNDLFARTTRRIELTEFGRFYLPYAEKQKALSEDTAKAVQRWKKHNTAAITVGISHHAHLFSITASIAAFRKANPEIPLRMVERSLEQLHKDLLEGKLSLITMAYPKGQLLPERFITAGESNLVAVLPSSHILATYQVIGLYHLSGRPLYLPEEHTLFADLIRDALLREGIHTDIMYQGSLPTRIDLMKQEPGILIDEARVVQEIIKDESFVIRPLEPQVGFVFGLEYAERLNAGEYRYMKFIRDLFAD